MRIRPAIDADRDPILAIARDIAEDGTTYAIDETCDLEKFCFGPGQELFVADDGTIAGFYLLKPNAPGRGSHVANAAYAVARSHRGRGLGKALAEHSLEIARERGYHAMQFNLVVSTNEPAVRAWKSLGFSIIGTLPQAYRHRTLGLVDAHVMYRFLDRR